jgi:hypothetical protein
MSRRKTQRNARTDKLKRTGNLCTYALMTCALVFAGCAQQQRRAIAVPVPDIGKAETMEVAEDVLARMHFTIEKADVPSGLIRTRPLPGAQFFEFWRSDNVGGKNSLQANLHTIRRTVELDISQHGDQLQIDCDVRVQRLSLPERDVSSSARAYGMFTRSSPSLQKMRFDTWQEKEIAWIDLEKDTRLAAEILKRIEKQLASRASAKPQVTESRT